MKPLHLWLAFVGTLAVAYASHDLQWLTDGRLWMRSVITNEAGKFNAGEVEGQTRGDGQCRAAKVATGSLEAG